MIKEECDALSTAGLLLQLRCPDRHVEDQYALYSSEVEFFSSRGLLMRRSVVRRLVCTACAEFAELHPVRFPSPVVEA